VNKQAERAFNLFRSLHWTKERLHSAAASLFAGSMVVAGWVLNLQFPAAAFVEAHSLLLRFVRRKA